MKRILFAVLLLFAVVSGCDLLSPEKEGGSIIDPPTEEICGDDIDNDKNGAVDEGCNPDPDPEPDPNPDPDPEPKSYNPRFQRVWTDESIPLVPGPNRFIVVDIDVAVSDTLLSMSIHNEDGELKWDTTFASPVSSTAFKIKIEVESMADARLTFKAIGVTGERERILTLRHVRSKMITSIGWQAGTYGIFLLDRYGEGFQRLFTYTAEETWPVGFGISPDRSKYFVFDWKKETSGCNHLLILDWRGEVAEDLGEDCRIKERATYATWSPDGSEIAFGGGVVNAHNTVEAFKLNLETNELTQLTRSECRSRSEVEGGEKCFTGIYGLAYAESGDLYVSRHAWQREDGEVKSLTEFGRFSQGSNTYESLVTFPLNKWLVKLDDIRDGVAVGEVERIDTLERYGRILIDLNNPEGYKIDKIGAQEFSLTPEGVSLGIPFSQAGNEIAFYGQGGQMVEGPYEITGLYRLTTPRLISAEENAVLSTE
ncbi:MAG: hypothetical protein WD579_00415 [Candidatus Paceibacterota bacterium]